MQRATATAINDDEEEDVENGVPMAIATAETVIDPSIPSLNLVSKRTDRGIPSLVPVPRSGVLHDHQHPQRPFVSAVMNSELDVELAAATTTTATPINVATLEYDLEMCKGPSLPASTIRDDDDDDDDEGHQQKRKRKKKKQPREQTAKAESKRTKKSTKTTTKSHSKKAKKPTSAKKHQNTKTITTNKTNDSDVSNMINSTEPRNRRAISSKKQHKRRTRKRETETTTVEEQTAVFDMSCRPELIRVSIVLSTNDKNDPLTGNHYEPLIDIADSLVDKTIRVVRIPTTSPFCATPIQPGDELLRVNGIDLSDKSAKQAEEYMYGAKEHLTIVVRNPSPFNPHVCWTYIQKRFAFAPSGIHLVDHGTHTDPSGENVVGGDIRIGHLQGNQAVRDSILYEGDRLLAINGHNCCIPSMTAASASTHLWDGSLLLVTPRRTATCSSAESKRPGMISLSFHVDTDKPTQSTPATPSPIGLSLRSIDGNHCVVAGIEPSGSFCKSPILVGDRIVTINGKHFFGDATAALTDLYNTVGQATVVVAVDGGKQGWLSTTVIKPTALVQSRDDDLLLGVRLARDSQVDRSRVTSVMPGCLLTNSLLEEGHRVFSLNGNDGLTLEEEIAILRSATTVTIVSQQPNINTAPVPQHQERNARMPIYQGSSDDEVRDAVPNKVCCVACIVIFVFLFIVLQVEQNNQASG